MSKHKGQKKFGKNQPPQPPAQPKAEAVPQELARVTEGKKSILEKIGSVLQFTTSQATPEEAAAVVVGPPAEKIDLEVEWKKIVTAFQLLEKQTSRKVEEALLLETERHKAEELTLELEIKGEDLDGREGKLEPKELALIEREQQLVGREQDLAKRWPQVQVAEEKQQRLDRLGAEQTELVSKSADDRAAAAQARGEAEALRADAQREAEQASAEREKLDHKLKALAAQKAEQDRRENDLLQRERDVAAREGQATAGFLGLNRKALADLEEKLAVLTRELATVEAEKIQARVELATSLTEERRQHAAELRSLRASAQSEIAAQREAEGTRLRNEEEGLKKRHDGQFSELETWYKRLQSEENKLRVDRANLESEKEALADARKHIDVLARQKAVREVEDLTGKLTNLQQKYEIASSERDRLALLINQHEEANRRLNNRSPEEIVSQIDELERRCQGLEQALDERPSVAASARLATLERASQQWEAQQEELVRQLQESQRRLGDLRPGVVELETLGQEKTMLEVSAKRLKNRIDELKREQDQAEADAANRPVFPMCAQLDESPEHQEEPITDRAATQDLKRFVHNLQQWIAQDSEAKTVMYYPEADIRSFLGGLAMSQLMILQGISGIGKTSFPVLFAQAIGAGRTIVEVQAGWRDRHDLVGHYNSFRNEFHEGKFLRALYEAHCPAYEQRLYFVILDEMNLSYPEQYFADLLSALEQPKPEDRRIELMARQLQNPPHHFEPDGQSLRIPDNVWFIGTANQDETTRGIADKTYDRAHILDLPASIRQFPLDPAMKHAPIVHYASLRAAFKTAAENPDYKAATEKGIKYLESLHDPLRTRLKVGWGNRLAGQLKKYIPVVMAADGSQGEALDYILAMKILRKIRDRHDTLQEHLDALKKKIEDTWLEFDPKYVPEKSFAVLDDEIERKRANL